MLIILLILLAAILILLYVILCISIYDLLDFNTKDYIITVFITSLFIIITTFLFYIVLEEVI